MKKAFPWFRSKTDPREFGKAVITGRSVVIREKRPADAIDDYAWRTDEELAQLDATHPLKMSSEEFIRYSEEELLYANPSSKRLSIDTLDGHHIGNCMYYDISAKRGEAELGIMIGDRNYWGKGYGTDSVDALLRYIFTATPLNRIYLHTLDWNLRARRCFTKSGFREVKKVRRSGMDFILMEVRRPEWEGRRTDGNRPPPLPQHFNEDRSPGPDEGAAPIGAD